MPSVTPPPTHNLTETWQNVPELRVPLVPRGTWDSRKTKKKIVIINLWATWCPPCIQEIPDFNDLYIKYQTQIDIIGISVNRSKFRLKKFMRETPILYPVGLITPGLLDELPHSKELPRTLIIDTKENRVISDHTGYMPKAYYETIINKIQTE